MYLTCTKSGYMPGINSKPSKVKKGVLFYQLRQVAGKNYLLSIDSSQEDYKSLIISTE